MKFSSALVLSAVAATALAESITTVITATKNGHVYTKTVTQDATFVWGGEGSAATSAAESSAAASSAAVTSAAATSAAASSVAVTSAVATSAAATSADEGSGSSITTVITATKNGHVYTKTVTQDATFVWTGEGSNTWAPSTSTSAEATSSASKTSATTVATSASAKSSTTAQISSFTGAADAITAGTGLMGAALAAVILL